MTKLKSNRQKTASCKSGKASGRYSAARAPSFKSAKSKASAKGAGIVPRGESIAKQTARPQSKQAQIIALLRAPGGATIGVMMRATGWQPHSVRGFLAGMVRKKLGLNLISAAAEDGRVYRIIDRTASSVPSAKMSQAV